MKTGILCVSIVLLMVSSGYCDDVNPLADAGLSRYAGSEPIQLDGTRSIAPQDFGPLTYAWQQVAGPPVILWHADSPTPTVGGFVQTDAVQRCDFELTVTDRNGRTAQDTVEVVIVPEFGPSTLALANNVFDPNKPLFIFFTGGSTCADGGGELLDDPGFLALTNHIGFPLGYSPDPGSDPRTFNRYAHMIIVYLSSVAPDYQQPIQTCGFSAGGMPALDLGVHMNQTYADARYAVNRVTLLDGGFCLGTYGQPRTRVETFAQHTAAGEAGWIDNYTTNSGYLYPNVLNVFLPLSHGGCAQWYFNSFATMDDNRIYNGITAGAYLSLLGPGRHLQLASTPGEQVYSFRWNGSETQGVMLLADAAHSARLLQPITLTGPEDGCRVDDRGVLLTCDASLNADGYQLLFGRDPYHMTHLFSDTESPPDTVVKTFPFEHTWWTVKAYDTYGSTIHADPRYIAADTVAAQPIENVTTGQTYASIQQAVLDARSGDEIVVSPGTCQYLENIEIRDKHLTLRSTDPCDPAVVAATVIHGGSRHSTVTLSGGDKAGVVIDGFTLTGDMACLSCLDAVSTTIRRCTMAGTGTTAIEFWGCEPTLIDCLVLGDVVDNALVAHWKLDEAQGSSVLDSAGEFHGTVLGEEEPDWQPDRGRVNGAILLDGMDDRIQTLGVLNPNEGPFSVFAWVKGSDAGQVILSQNDGANWLLTDPVHGNLQTELRSGGRRDGPVLTSQVHITDGNWHHIGLTWDGSIRTLYVDHAPAATDTNAQLNLKDASGPFHIGVNHKLEPGTFWSGMLDDIRIYDRVVKP
ncbi:MAG: LamG domain-containing protein [Phycisphaerae bacterium]|nr:LamG domain-containing protein [Phycisphaerae bacterium]